MRYNNNSTTPHAKQRRKALLAVIKVAVSKIDKAEDKTGRGPFHYLSDHRLPHNRNTKRNKEEQKKQMPQRIGIHKEAAASAKAPLCSSELRVTRSLLAPKQRVTLLWAGVLQSEFCPLAEVAGTLGHPVE